MTRIALLITCLLISLSARAADASFADFICNPVTNAEERAQCLERASVVTRNESSKISQGPAEFLLSMIWPVGWWVIYYSFGLLIGRYVYRDAKQREWIFLGIRPVWWGVLAFFDAAFGLLAYWAFHYSKFAQSYHEATTPPATASAPNA